MVASILVLVGLPLQLVGVVGSPITDGMWMPMLAFELLLAFRLIVRGAAIPQGRPT